MSNMRRKGISPLIAAVLLIAFTMAVASLFAQWAPQLIQNAQGDTTNRSQQIQKCSGITLEFVSANAENATIQQATGQEAVGDVQVTWLYENEGPQQSTVSIDQTRGVNQTTGGSSTGTLDKVTATPIDCEGAGATTYTP